MVDVSEVDSVSENAHRCFLNVLLKQVVLSNNPTLVVLELTRRCNLWCPMCRTKEWWRELREQGAYLGDLDERVLDDAKGVIETAGHIYLSLYGEPFMHKQCRTIIRRVRELNERADILMTSNLTLPKEADLCTLIRQRVSLVNVSIDSPHPDTYEKIRRGANLDSVVGNLRRLLVLKRRLRSDCPRIAFSFVVMKETIGDVLDFVAFAEEFDPHWIVLHDVVPRRGTLAVPLTDADYERNMDGFEDAERRAKAAGIPLFGSAVGRFHTIRSPGKSVDSAPLTEPRCLEPFRTLVIDADGSISPCCYYKGEPMGNICEEGFEAIWNGPKYRSLRTSLNEGSGDEYCRECLGSGFRTIC